MKTRSRTREFQWIYGHAIGHLNRTVQGHSGRGGLCATDASGMWLSDETGSVGGLSRWEEMLFSTLSILNPLSSVYREPPRGIGNTFSEIFSRLRKFFPLSTLLERMTIWIFIWSQPGKSQTIDFIYLNLIFKEPKSRRKSIIWTSLRPQKKKKKKGSGWCKKEVTSQWVIDIVMTLVSRLWDRPAVMSPIGWWISKCRRW
jgi:hypothetical protein